MEEEIDAQLQARKGIFKENLILATESMYNVFLSMDLTLRKPIMFGNLALEKHNNQRLVKTLADVRDQRAWRIKTCPV
jgi:hypothetical protein